MKKGIPFLTFIIIAVSALICSLAIAPPAQALISLMNGDLRLDGFVKEYIFVRDDIPAKEQRFHNTNADEMLTSAMINILYKVKEDQCQTLNVFGAFKYYYDLAPATDHAQRSAIPSSQRSYYQKPKDEDIISEAYMDYIRGPFNIKVGKQIVVWGETDIKRTVDVVNPLDMRYGSPGVISWSEMKLGMWMIRGFYQSQLPGNLLFEVIYNPGYFQGIRLPVEGTQWGPWPNTVSFNPGHGPGIYNWTVTEAWQRYQPKKWQMDNWQLGFRLRGFTYNIDWTLVYLNQMSPAPVGVPGAITSYATNYVIAGLRSQLDTNEFIRPEPYYGPRPYDWKRYQLFGGTAQTTIDKLHGSVWRLEYFYEHNMAYNESTTGNTQGTIYDIVKRDTFGFGLNYGDKFLLPYIGRNWFNNQFLQVSLTAFYEKILNYNKDLVVDGSRDHEYNCSTSQSYSWNIMQQFDNAIWTFIFMGSWSPIGKWWMSPMIGYGPGNHWRIEGGPIIYHSNNKVNKGYYDKSSVLIRIRYEF